MNPRVARQLRMKGRNEYPAGAQENRLIRPCPEHFRALSGVLENRSADEHCVEGPAVYTIQIDFRLERLVLTSIRVAPHREVQNRKWRLPVGNLIGENNCAGASSKRRHPIFDPFGQVVAQLESIDELDDCG
jgi:hypothetical protein